MIKQTSFFDKAQNAYGGVLLKKRKARMCGRPLSTKSTMHLVLRSSKAKGKFSFKNIENEMGIRDILNRFAEKYHIKIYSLANVGNHLHLQIKLTLRASYKPFIRAITAAIAMFVTNASRWRESALEGKFWDYRPFTRIVDGGHKAFLGLRDYIQINILEGCGYKREQARWIIAKQRGYFDGNTS